MIFWILTAVAVLVVIGTTVYVYRESGYLSEALLNGLFTLVATAAIWWAGVLLAIGAWGGAAAEAVKAGTEQRNLTALSTGETTSGHWFFLGSGYIDGRQVFNYLERDDEGGVRLKQANANISVVYEGEDDPYLEVTTWDSVAPWWITPYPVFDKWERYTYEFHVPEGSVLNGYEVRP